MSRARLLMKRKHKAIFLMTVFYLLSGCKKGESQPSFIDAGKIKLESIKQVDNICTVVYSVNPVEEINTESSKLIYSVAVTADGCDKNGNVHSYSVSDESITIDFTSEENRSVEVKDINTEELKYLNVYFSYTKDTSSARTQVITWMSEET